MQTGNTNNNNINSISSASPPPSTNTPSIVSISTPLANMSTDGPYHPQQQQQQSQNSNQQEVKLFLSQCGLPQYYSLFIEEGFDRPESLLELTETDLIQMQVKRGHRRLLQRALANAKGIPSNVPLNITPLLNNNNKDLTGYTLPTQLPSSQAQTPKSTIQPNEAIDVSLQLLPVNNSSPITSSASSTNASSTTSSFTSSSNTALNNANTNDPNNMSLSSTSNSGSNAPNTNNVNATTPTTFNMYNSNSAANTQRIQPQQMQQQQKSPSVPQSQPQPQPYFNTLNTNTSTITNFNNNLNNYPSTAHNYTNPKHAEYFPSAGTMTQQSGGGMSSTEEEAVTSDNVHRLWKRKYHRHAKPDTNAPVKPPSAYVMFSNAVRAELKEQNKSFTDLAKIIGDRWKNISPREKEMYETNALRAREEYLKKVEEYQKTDAYKRYQQYISEFKAENEAAARPVGRPRKRSKKEGEFSDGNASDSASKRRASSISSQAATDDHSVSHQRQQQQAQPQPQQQHRRNLSVSSSDQRHYPFYLLNEDSQAFQQQNQPANTSTNTNAPPVISRSPGTMLPPTAPPPPHTSPSNNKTL